MEKSSTILSPKQKRKHLDWKGKANKGLSKRSKLKEVLPEVSYTDNR